LVLIVSAVTKLEYGGQADEVLSA